MKAITLTGLRQVDELSPKCTPVEDTTMAGEKVIRCQEAVEAMDATAPKTVTLGRVAKKRSRKRARKPSNKSCVPEWINVRSRGGKMVRRCHCKGGPFLKNERCSRG